MNRATWTVAWRHARRHMSKGAHDEAALLDLAQTELGGERLSLDRQCAALRCWTSRHYGPAEASFANARTRRWYALSDMCSERWMREDA